MKLLTWTVALAVIGYALLASFTFNNMSGPINANDSYRYCYASDTHSSWDCFLANDRPAGIPVWEGFTSQIPTNLGS